MRSEQDYMEGLRLFYLSKYDEALPIFLRTAEAGNAKAQHFLALMYQNGNGVERDLERAAYWYDKTARQGDSEAQLTYAMILALGKGTAQDIAAACHWATVSYHSGNEKAWQTLQIIRVEAQEAASAAIEAFKAAHLAGDDAQAASQLERAAECGSADAQYAYARLLQGDEKAPLGAALLWLREAAAQNHAEARALLASLTEIDEEPEK